MVGRAEELGRLRAMVHPGGSPRVVMVSGEAGVGKTRLIQELATHVPRRVPVLTGQAEQGAMGRPYQLLLEAVAAQCRNGSGSRRNCAAGRTHCRRCWRP